MSEEEQVALSLDDIKAADDMALVTVEVPQWGGVVKVKPFTIDERRSVRKVGESPKKHADGSWGVEYDPEEIELEALIQGCVEPTFTRADKDWLRRQASAGAISKVTKVILAISGMGDDSVKEPERS